MSNAANCKKEDPVSNEDKPNAFDSHRLVFIEWYHCKLIKSISVKPWGKTNGVFDDHTF